MKKKCISVVILLITLSFAYSNNGARSLITGVVTNSVLNEPVPFVDVNIEVLHRLQTTPIDGSFTFRNIPFGTYKITFSRIGFDPVTIDYIVNKKKQTLNMQMHPSHLGSDEILVETDAVDNTIKSDVSVRGKSLRKNMSTTIAETISKEPGISFRSMGSAPARPVLRGLGGDRLLILEDNSSAGDMSATSADHAVAIDPLTSNHIDVIRGPESILFGSNTMGGVVNVVRGAIPIEMPENFEGVSSLQGSSVSNNLAVGQNMTLPFNNFVFRVDGSFRKAQNIQSPKKEIKNSLLETTNVSAGSSYHPDWGFLGTSFTYYKSDYGIPPDPISGHASGASIDMKRTQIKSKAKIYTNNSVFNTFNIKHTFSRYEHAEIERSLNTVGQSFGVVTNDITADFKLSPTEQWNNGVLGFEYSHRDYKTGGRSNTPYTQAKRFSIFTYHNFPFSKQTSINGSFRYDVKTITPLSNSNEIGNTGLYPKERRFNGFSGGLSVQHELIENLTLNLVGLKTFRAPSLEDLFSDGPHLANYTFEVGNPNLGEENGYSVDLSLEYVLNENRFKLTGYRNSFSGFIFSENTGRFSQRLASLYEYQYVGKDALMYGFEFNASILPIHEIKLESRLSYTFGELLDESKPLPYVPPMEGNISISHEHDFFSHTLSMNFATSQTRINIPNELLESGRETDLETFKFQRETDGYQTFDLSSEYHFMKYDLFHTVTFSVSNVLNTVYQKHLNRIKHIFPEPGRDLKLLYKVFF